MESDGISMIEDRATPESIREVQVLLRFTYLYLLFIRKYDKVTTPISDVLNKEETSRTPKQLKWAWTWDVEHGFRKLNKDFTDVPILNHFVLAKPIFRETDACGFAIASICNQYDSLGILRPVNFYCQK
jgi:hypothetical protein